MSDWSFGAVGDVFVNRDDPENAFKYSSDLLRQDRSGVRQLRGRIHGSNGDGAERRVAGRVFDQRTARGSATPALTSWRVPTTTPSMPAIAG